MEKNWMSRLGKEIFTYHEIAEYMRENHPEVPFNIDYVAFRKIGPNEWKHVNIFKPFRFPKFFLLKPNRRYKGLYLEIIAEGSKALLADGTAKQGSYICRVEAMINILNDSGFRACFTRGFRRSVDEIENYLKL